MNSPGIHFESRINLKSTFWLISKALLTLSLIMPDTVAADPTPAVLKSITLDQDNTIYQMKDQQIFEL